MIRRAILEADERHMDQQWINAFPIHLVFRMRMLCCGRNLHCLILERSPRGWEGKKLKEKKKDIRKAQKTQKSGKGEEGRNTLLGKASNWVVESKVDVNHGDRNNKKLRIKNSHLWSHRRPWWAHPSGRVRYLWVRREYIKERYSG